MSALDEALEQLRFFLPDGKLNDKATDELSKIQTALDEIKTVSKLAKGFWKEAALNGLIAWHEKWKELFK